MERSATTHGAVQTLPTATHSTCHQCGTHRTPLWRVYLSHKYCNACGIRKKRTLKPAAKTKRVPHINFTRYKLAFVPPQPPMDTVGDRGDEDDDDDHPIETSDAELRAASILFQLYMLRTRHT